MPEWRPRHATRSASSGLGPGLSGIEKAPPERGFLVWPGTELNRRHEDFQAVDIVREIGSHGHGMTSSDVVTRLNAIELCH
jgi:hypothetical protein